MPQWDSGKTIFLAATWSLKIKVSEKVQNIRDETCWEPNCAEWNSSFTCWSATRSWPIDPLTFYHTAECLTHRPNKQFPQLKACVLGKGDPTSVMCTGTVLKTDETAVWGRLSLCDMSVNKLLAVNGPSIHKDQCPGWPRRSDWVSPSLQTSLCNDDFPMSKLSRAANGDSSGNIILQDFRM